MYLILTYMMFCEVYHPKGDHLKPLPVISGKSTNEVAKPSNGFRTSHHNILDEVLFFAITPTNKIIHIRGCNKFRSHKLLFSVIRWGICNNNWGHMDNNRVNAFESYSTLPSTKKDVPFLLLFKKL